MKKLLSCVLVIFALMLAPMMVSVSDAFYNCENLKQVTIGNGVTAIQSYAFGKCPSLKEITLPASLLVINSNAFYCSDWNYVSPLDGIRMMGDAPLMANDAFTGVKATVYYSANNATCTRGQIVSFPYRAYK